MIRTHATGPCTCVTTGAGTAGTALEGCAQAVCATLASNIGNVAVNKAQLQAVVGSGAYVASVASGNKARVVQNLSTNNACVTCQ